VAKGGEKAWYKGQESYFLTKVIRRSWVVTCGGVRRRKGGHKRGIGKGGGWECETIEECVILGDKNG